MSLKQTARARFPHPSTVGVGHKKKSSRPKPDWNDAVNDLELYRASPEEVAQRKESRKSKNADLIRHEQQEKAITRDLKARDKRGSTASEKRQIAILKEIFFDQDEFQDVLSQTDKALAMVKDMFGDNVKKYVGLPQVTHAPHREDVTESRGGSRASNHDDQNDGRLPRCPELNTSRLDDLSQRVMAKVALNDGHDNFENGDTGAKNDDLAYATVFDKERFQKFFTKVQSEQTTPTKQKDFSGLLSVMNDSGKILRTRAPLSDDKENQTNRTQSAAMEVGFFVKQLEDLRKSLSVLDLELRDYERVTGRTKSTGSRPTNDGSLTGCTAQVTDIVLALVKYLREVDEELRAERKRSAQLSLQLNDSHRVLDGLTADFLLLRDEFINYRADSDKKFASLVRPMVKSAPRTKPGALDSACRPSEVAPAPAPVMRAKDEAGAGVPARIKQAAFLLSPPRQRDSQYQPQYTVSVTKPTSLVDSDVRAALQGNPLVQTDRGRHRWTNAGLTAAEIRDDANDEVELSLQIADLALKHREAQVRIAQLQKQNSDLEGIAAFEFRSAQPTQMKLNLAHFNDVTTSEPIEDVSNHSGSTHCGVPSIPADDDEATPRSLTSLLSDRDVIDQQLSELVREHQLTQARMKSLQNQFAANEMVDKSVSPAISPIPIVEHDKITIHLPSVTSDTP